MNGPIEHILEGIPGLNLYDRSRVFMKFLGYSPNIRFHIETPKYVLKTAETQTELMEVFTLRHDIFLPHKKGQFSQIDLDQFDTACDHIVIVDKQSGEVCGTYRVLSSHNADNFYSQNEFNLDQFLKQKGPKLELGRACISQEHRNGAVIDLLWKGIAKYINLTDTRFLFGCSSVHTTRKEIAEAIYSYFVEENLHSDDYQIRPYGEFVMPNFSTQGPSSPVLDEPKTLVPSLIRSYLKAGAKIQGIPAVDYDFECVDYMMILDMTNVSRLYYKRYFA